MNRRLIAPAVVLAVLLVACGPGEAEAPVTTQSDQTVTTGDPETTATTPPAPTTTQPPATTTTRQLTLADTPGVEIGLLHGDWITVETDQYYGTTPLLDNWRFDTECSWECVTRAYGIAGPVEFKNDHYELLWLSAGSQSSNEVLMCEYDSITKFTLTVDESEVHEGVLMATRVTSHVVHNREVTFAHADAIECESGVQKEENWVIERTSWEPSWTPG